MVRHDVAIVGELSTADGALAVLDYNLCVQQLSHFRV